MVGFRARIKGVDRFPLSFGDGFDGKGGTPRHFEFLY